MRLYTPTSKLKAMCSSSKTEKKTSLTHSKVLFREENMLKRKQSAVQITYIYTDTI